MGSGRGRENGGGDGVGGRSESTNYTEITEKERAVSHPGWVGGFDFRTAKGSLLEKIFPVAAKGPLKKLNRKGAKAAKEEHPIEFGGQDRFGLFGH